MRRRDILQHIGGSVVVFSVATSRVSANEGDRRSDALEHVSSKHNVAKENLEVLNDSIASWSTLGESYYQAKIHDSSNKRMYRVLLDENNEDVNRQGLHDREEEKYQSLYGKYSQQLNNKISNANQDDTFEVNVRLKSEAVDRQGIGRKAKKNTNDDTKTNRKLREKLKRRRINKIEDATKELADRISNLSSTNIKQRGTATARITMES